MNKAIAGCYLEDALRIAVHVSEAREFFIELFPSTEQKFKSVSASVAKGFSSSSRLSPRERALLGLDVLDEPKAQSARPSVAVVLLAAYKVKGRTFFDGRVLSRSAQATLRSIAGFLSQERPTLTNLALLASFEGVLCRAYADACQRVLETVTGSVFKVPRKAWRPHVVVTVRRRNGEVLLIWTPDEEPRPPSSS